MPNFLGFNYTPGTWGGLPDFGITERLGLNPYASAQTPQQSWQPPQSTQTQSQINAYNTSRGNNIAVSGGNTGNFNTNTYQQEQGQQQQQDPFAGIRSGINSGWDNYISSLNSMLDTGLTGQRTAQEDIANSQYTQGVNTLDLQKTQGMDQFAQQRGEATANQAKTLRDIAGNIRNAFQAGNNFLGQRGAGDSSATDQYSFALTKIGNQKRGDVMGQTSGILNQIAGRETNLKNIYDSETRNLAEAKNQAIAGISNWFAGAQNQIRQQIAQGHLNRQQDINALNQNVLNQSLQQLAQVNQNVEARYNELTQWATSHATNIAQVKANMNQISQYAPQYPGFSPMNGQMSMDSGGNFQIPSGFSNNAEDQKTNMFGMPV